MKNIFYIVVFLSLLSCRTTHRSKKYDGLDITKYINVIQASDLSKHLYIVASDQMQGRETGSQGQKKAGQYLIAQYEKMGISFPKGTTGYYQKVPAAYMAKPFGPKLPDSENIWAYIEGSEKPDEILVLSAHYDHVGINNGEIYNGADDDGSGTVALLEIAKAFKKAQKDGYGPKRSILFLHVTAEEHGLHGSRYYTDHPLFPLDHTITDLNIDMIGRRDEKHQNNPYYIYLVGSDRLSTDLHTLSEQVNKKYINLELDYQYNDPNEPQRIYYRSDHYNFAKHGIPSLFYFNGIHEDYHMPGDTPDKIEYDILQQRTRLIFVTAWELANREHRPIVDKNGI